jgi:hypothetical protein
MTLRLNRGQLVCPQEQLSVTVHISLLSRLPSRMASKEELAFLKELSLKVLRQLKGDINAQKRKTAAEASAKAQGSGEQPGSAGEETSVSQREPKTAAGKRKATVLNSSNSGGSMGPAARHPAPGPLSGAGCASVSAGKGKNLLHG